MITIKRKLQNPINIFNRVVYNSLPVMTVIAVSSAGIPTRNEILDQYVNQWLARNDYIEDGIPDLSLIYNSTIASLPIIGCAIGGFIVGACIRKKPEAL